VSDGEDEDRATCPICSGPMAFTDRYPTALLPHRQGQYILEHYVPARFCVNPQCGHCEPAGRPKLWPKLRPTA
jgi:hypothetical protein